MSLGRVEGYHPISSSSFTFFYVLLSRTLSPPTLTHHHPFKNLPYDGVHYANEWLTVVMASREGERGCEEGRRGAEGDKDEENQ